MFKGKNGCFLLFVLGILSLSAVITYLIFSTIDESSDCDQLVTDTNEIYLSINIPSNAKMVNCTYNSFRKTRISHYILNHKDLVIKGNGFKPLTNFKILKAIDSLTNIDTSDAYLFFKNRKFGVEGLVISNTSTNDLWVVVKK